MENINLWIADALTELPVMSDMLESAKRKAAQDSAKTDGRGSKPKKRGERE